MVEWKKLIEKKENSKKSWLNVSFILLTYNYLFSDFLKNTVYAPYNRIAAIAIINTFSAGHVAGVTIFGVFSGVFIEASAL